MQGQYLGSIQQRSATFVDMDGDGTDDAFAISTANNSHRIGYLQTGGVWSVSQTFQR